MKNDTSKMIRDLIRLAIADIRAARAHLSVTALVAEGFTLASSGSPNQCLNVKDKDENGKVKINFLASWKDGASYYSKARAEQVLTHLRKNHPSFDILKPEIVHETDLAKRALENGTDLVKKVFSRRNG